MLMWNRCFGELIWVIFHMLIGNQFLWELIFVIFHTKVHFYENPTINENDAIQDEHDSFAKSINLDKEPEVSATDGYNALKLANQIIERL